MEEQKERNTIENNIRSFYNVKFRPSLEEIGKHKADKQYELMNLARLRIDEEIAQQKANEHQINQKLTWFPYLDQRIEWIKWEINNLEPLKPSLPINSAPRTTGFLRFPDKDSGIPIRPDRKRCQKRLVKKGKMDMEYMQQVEEQLLYSKKYSGMISCGTQEINDMIEIKKLKVTKAIYTAQEPDPDPHRHLTSREIRSKRDTDWKRSTQHRINIRLDDIEKIKRDQMGRKAKVRRLKADLELVRKSISSLKKKLESVNSKRIEAYEHAHELGEQNREMKSCYEEYQSLKRYVKQLARKGDFMGVKQVCDTQVDGFMKQWRDNKAFRDDYEKRKSISKG